MKKTLFTGAATALITPMKNGAVDYEKFGEIIDFQINNKIDALVVCGTTGESSTLSDAEHREAIKFCVEKTAGRVPVIAGTGSNDTSYAIELSKSRVERLKRDVLLYADKNIFVTDKHGAPEGPQMSAAHIGWYQPNQQHVLR